MGETNIRDAILEEIRELGTADFRNMSLQDLAALTRRAGALAACGRALSPLSRRTPDEMALYFARCGDAVKIGRATNAEARREALQAGSPGPLELVAVIERAGHRESECHRRMSHLRIHGEWFRYTPEIDGLIAELEAAVEGR